MPRMVLDLLTYWTGLCSQKVHAEIWPGGGGIPSFLMWIFGEK